MKITSILVIAGCLLAPFAIGHASSIAAGDLLVFQAGSSTVAASSGSSPLIIDEITTGGSFVQSWDISTMSSPLYTDNEGTAGDLSLSDNGTMLTFSGWTSGASTENTVLSRGAGELSVSGVYTAGPTYTGASGKATRSAYTPDGTNWYFADAGGVYSYTPSGGSIMVSSSSTRDIEGSAGTTYGMETTSSAPSKVGTFSPSTPNDTTVTYGSLSGVVADSNAIGYTILSSGHSGTGVYDTIYTESQPSGSKNYIDKYCLSGGSWVLSGSFQLGSSSNIEQITAEEVGSGDVDLFVTGDPSSSNAYVDEFQDDTGFNTSTLDTGSAFLTGSTTIFTAASGEQLQGISFAPVPEPATFATAGLGAVLLLLGSRRFRSVIRKG